MRSASGHVETLDRRADVGRGAGSSRFGATAGSARSWPAQKPRPVPVTTTQRTSRSPAAASSAARSSSCIAPVKLLSAFGPVQREGADAAGMADANERLFHGGLLSAPGQNIVDRPVGNSVGRAPGLGKRSSLGARRATRDAIRQVRFRNASRRRSPALRPRRPAALSSSATSAASTSLAIASRTRGWTYDFLHTATVLPSWRATSPSSSLMPRRVPLGGACAFDPERERVRRAVPGAEVLGGEVGAARLADVVVDVGRADAAHRAVVVDVLEQVLPRHRLAAPHDAGDARIVERDLVLLAALAAKAQAQAARPPPRRGDCAASSGRTSGWCARIPRCRRARRSCRAAARCVASTVSRDPAASRPARRGRRRRASGCAAAPRRTRAFARTCRRRGRRASRGDSGTACGRARRGRSPGDGRWAACRSRRLRTPAGSRGRGCGAARRPSRTRLPSVPT